jgi:gamma-glutamyltranspeptidase/glutathione hydrolase
MRTALATDVRLIEPMLEALRKGNPADAIATGLLLAAAYEPSVLLGPAQILIAGTGTGNRAIDGRNRQPGLGAKRPRGFLASDRIPLAARVGVPGLPAAALLLQANHGKAKIAVIVSIVKPLARSTSKVRGAVIERVLAGGAAVLGKEKALLDAAGPVEGGVLTKTDLESVRPATMKCAVDKDVSRAPWDRGSGRPVQLLAACDKFGVLAVACYEIAEDGLRIDALELVAPLVAEPVRRGITRRSPGDPLPAPCPLALKGDMAIAAPDEALLEETLESDSKLARPLGILAVRA